MTNDTPNNDTLWNGASGNKMLDTFNTEQCYSLSTKYVKMTAPVRDFSRTGRENGRENGREMSKREHKNKIVKTQEQTCVEWMEPNTKTLNEWMQPKAP